jgi:hypothetical protein
MTDTWETTVRTAADTMLRYPDKISGPRRPAAPPREFPARFAPTSLIRPDRGMR